MAEQHWLDPIISESQRIPTGSNSTGEFSGNAAIEESPIGRGINALAAGYGAVALTRGLAGGIEGLSDMFNGPKALESGSNTYMAPNEGGSIPTLRAKVPEAIFTGKQNVPDEEGFNWFKVLKEGHPLQGSEVSAKTLLENNLHPEINAPDVPGMLKAGKSMESIEQAIQDTQNAHAAVANAYRDIMSKILNRPANIATVRG